MGVGLSRNNDSFDGYNMFDRCHVFHMFDRCHMFHCLIGVYDNQMDRSRQEFAAMYDVRVRFSLDSHYRLFSTLVIVSVRHSVVF